MFDLAREYVDASDDEHIVGTSAQSRDSSMGASAFAGFGDDAGDVPRAVADQRHAFLADGGDDKLAVFAVGQGLRLSADR